MVHINENLAMTLNLNSDDGNAVSSCHEYVQYSTIFVLNLSTLVIIIIHAWYIELIPVFTHVFSFVILFLMFNANLLHVICKNVCPLDVYESIKYSYSHCWSIDIE